MNKKIWYILTLLFSVNTSVSGQSLAVNTDGSSANASALLDVKSNSKGMLIPRMSRTGREAIASPATGLLIFQNAPDSIGFYYYDGGKWTWLLSNANADSLAWRTGGNTGTTDGYHFIGTKDNVPFNIRVNNQMAGKIDQLLNNSFYGYRAGNSISFGSGNTGIGHQALFSNTTGSSNSAFGQEALYTNANGINNTAVGREVLYSNTAGSSNTAIGRQALYSNINGSTNTAIGREALYFNSNGSSNSATGFQALYKNISGIENSATGVQALYNNTSGDFNTATGQQALFANTTGTGNTAVGTQAMVSNSTGYSNIAIGAHAMRSGVSSNNIIAIGDSSLFNSTGPGNMAIGSKAGYSVTTGTNNLFLGYQAGYNETGSNKLYIANSSANPPLIYGDFSSGRIGIGTISPGDKLEVNGNIRFSATGTLLAAPSTIGSAYSVTIRAGDPYVPVGGSGGSVNITATNNMPSGGSGYGNLGPSGDVNITSGTGYNTAGGNINIIAGQTSCWALTGNSHSDVNIQGGANLVAADAASINLQGGGTVGASCPTANANGGSLILKSGIGTGTGLQGNIQLLNGNVGIGTSTPSQKLHVVGSICYTGGLAACSDVRYKKNIKPLQNNLSKLMQLKGVDYYWKTSEYSNMEFTERKQIGFIAQDLEKIFPEMVFTDDKGYKSIDYSRLTPVLVETIKEQQKEINAVNKRLEALEKMIHK
jgi:hypothetical protein